MKKLINSIKDEIREMEGIQARKRTYSISARLKKHYCPYCGSLLEVKEKKQIVNSESEEAKHFDFTSMFEGGSLFGNIEFTWDIYYCARCQIEISISDLKTYEKRLKKEGGYIDFNKIREESHYEEKKSKIPNLHIIGLVLVVIGLVLVVIQCFSS